MESQHSRSCSRGNHLKIDDGNRSNSDGGLRFSFTANILPARSSGTGSPPTGAQQRLNSYSIPSVRNDQSTTGFTRTRRSDFCKKSRSGRHFDCIESIERDRFGDTVPLTIVNADGERRHSSTYLRICHGSDWQLHDICQFSSLTTAAV